MYWGAVVIITMIEGGHAEGGEVTYDGRSLIIDGQRKLLFSGSIHYPRSTPEVNDLHSSESSSFLFFFFFFFSVMGDDKPLK